MATAFLNGQTPGCVKSVQTGENRVTATSFTVTLPTSVVPTRSIVIARMCGYATAATAAHQNVKVVLTNANTLTFTVTSYNASYAPYVDWMVIEFNSRAKPKQEGTITTVAGTATATLTTAVSSKAILVYTYSTTSTNAYIGTSNIGCVLTNSTTVTARSLAAGGSVHYEVIDFY